MIDDSMWGGARYQISGIALMEAFLKGMISQEQLIGCLVQIVGRATIPPEKVRELVGTGKATLNAFNMCNGLLTQKEIAKKLRIDQGQLSRTFDRWVVNGIAFRVGDATEARLLHIYPIPKNGRGNKPKRGQRR
jgi:hypothetical protein